MNKIFFSAIAALFLFASPVFGLNSKEIADCIRNPECHRTFIVAHRGRGFGAPENSRETVRKAVAAGVPVIEIDIRLSKDDELYVLHNAHLDGATNERGAIKEKMSSELENVLLENGETIPMFRDIYDLTSGKALLDLHFKVDAVEKVAEWIYKNGSFDDVIFFVNTKNLMQSAAQAKNKYPQMIVMPRLGGESLEKIEKIFGAPPEILHTNFPSEESLEHLHGRGIKVFANILGIEDTFWPIKQIAENWVYAYGTDFIQTDDPKPWLKKIRKDQRKLLRP